MSIEFDLLQLNLIECDCDSVSWLSDDHATFYSVTDIYVFAIGAEIYDDDLKPLTVGTDGKHYFRMKNEIGNLEETFDNIIGKAPKWRHKNEWLW